jgi:hypothetical protein
LYKKSNIKFLGTEEYSLPLTESSLERVTGRTGFYSSSLLQQDADALSHSKKEREKDQDPDTHKPAGPHLQRL